MDKESVNHFSIFNPAFIVKNWGLSKVEVNLNDKVLEKAKDFRVGYQKTPKGTDLVFWIKIESQKELLFEIVPVEDKY